MPGLTLESLRAITTQANRELASAQRKLEHAERFKLIRRARMRRSWRIGGNHE